MITGILIFLVSVVVLILDIKFIMQNDKSEPILMFFGGLLITAIFWGNIINFGYNILPTLAYIPASYGCGAVIGIVLVLIIIVRFFGSFKP